MKHAESDLQISCVSWARLQYPRALLYAIPNGGKRPTKTTRAGVTYSPEAVRLKKEGVLAGVADLALDEARGGYFGLKIEMKVSGGTLSPSQREYRDKVQAAGYRWAMCLTFEAFTAELTYYFSLPPTPRLSYGRP